MRRVLVVGGILVLVVAAGCSTTGLINGPVLTSPDALFRGGYDAEIDGRLVFDDVSGCLLLDGDFGGYPVVWPAGALWWGDPPRVRLRGGVFVEPGMWVTGSGGFFQRDFVERIAGSEVADAAAACAGPTGEIAVFNHRSRVTVSGEAPG